MATPPVLADPLKPSYAEHASSARPIAGREGCLSAFERRLRYATGEVNAFDRIE
jgi:hypothetical protein